MHLTNQSKTISGFEGPEKKLVVHFQVNLKKRSGLRAVSRDIWQTVLEHAKCTIISCTRNEHFDSYVLSESSLFVYPYKILLKTCGTTTLLHCLSKLMEVARDFDTSVELVMYSRKNLNFPAKQLYPHVAFDDEIHFLNKLFEGQGHVLGATNKDHWNFYVADCRTPSSAPRVGQTFEVMMHDLSPEVMAQFYQQDGVTASDTTRSSGIADLIPGSIIDDFQFEPCGYSMNGLLRDSYWTIHITPEPHCSYVSFETNAPFTSFSRILKRVLGLFQPGRATVAILADDTAPCGDVVSSFDPFVPGFVHQGHTLQTFSNNLSVLACSYVADRD